MTKNFEKNQDTFVGWRIPSQDESGKVSNFSRYFVVLSSTPSTSR